MTRTSNSFAFVGIISRTALVALGALCMAPSASAQDAAPAVMHACYVPLTGTVYRIKESGLRTTCSSTSHVEFSWTDGDGALRPTGAAAGDLLQFDGTQWKPVSAQSIGGGGGGGVTGYEVATVSATNSYGAPFPVVVQVSPCSPIIGCGVTRTVAYVYRTVAPGATVTLSCPAGKKAFGVFGGAPLGADIMPTGSVSVTLPASHRDGPVQAREVPASLDPTTHPELLPNLIPGQPSTAPDSYSVKLICANAS